MGCPSIDNADRDRIGVAGADYIYGSDAHIPAACSAGADWPLCNGISGIDGSVNARRCSVVDGGSVLGQDRDIDDGISDFTCGDLSPAVIRGFKDSKSDISGIGAAIKHAIRGHGQVPDIRAVGQRPFSGNSFCRKIYWRPLQRICGEDPVMKRDKRAQLRPKRTAAAIASEPKIS